MIEVIKAGVFDSSEKFKNKIVTPERVAQCYEIELYIDGEGESYINSVAYPHEKGNFVFVKPGDIRFSRNKFHCFYVHLNIPSPDVLMFRHVLPMSKTSDYDGYMEILTDIFKLWDGEEKRPMLLQSKVCSLLDMILCDNEFNINSARSGVSAEAIRRAAAFIEENYMNRITLKDIADAARFSPIYFHKLFSEFMGKTPHEFLTEKRFEVAKIYLLTTDLSLGEIVERCGFSSHSYFDCHFKKFYGITPSELRKRRYVF